MLHSPYPCGNVIYGQVLPSGKEGFSVKTHLVRRAEYNQDQSIQNEMINPRFSKLTDTFTLASKKCFVEAGKKNTFCHLTPGVFGICVCTLTLTPTHIHKSIPSVIIFVADLADIFVVRYVGRFEHIHQCAVFALPLELLYFSSLFAREAPCTSTKLSPGAPDVPFRLLTPEPKPCIMVTSHISLTTTKFENKQFPINLSSIAF